MYKTIRKSVAEAIATVENPEQFQWNKWLREPQIYLERFAKPRIEIKKIDSFSKFEQPALFQVKRFALSKFKVSEEIKNVLIKKKKTFKVFVTFPKTHQHEIKILRSGSTDIQHYLSVYWKKKEFYIKHKYDHKDSYFKISPQTIHHNIDVLSSTTGNDLAVLPPKATISEDLSIRKVEVFDCILVPFEKFNSPLVSNYNVLNNISIKKCDEDQVAKLNKKPKVKEFPLVNLDDIKQDFVKSCNRIVKEVELDSLDQKPKLYQVKLHHLEKKRASLFQLNNLQLTSVALKNFDSVAITKPSISRHTLKEEVFSAPEIEDPPLPIQLLYDDDVKVSKNNLTEVTLETENEEADAIEVRQFAELAENRANAELIHHQPITNSITVDELIPINLLPYQKEGIRYLLNEQAAVISDELGLEKMDQAIHALAIKIKQGKINKTVIVSPSVNIGDKELNYSIEQSTGWENFIQKSYPDLIFLTITNYSENILNENERPNLLIFDYASFFSWISNESSDVLKNNLDCIIFDEGQYLLTDQTQLESLTKLPSSHNIWLLTSLPRKICEERIIPKLKNYLSAFENFNDMISRTKSIVKEEMPDVQRHDYWLRMDRDQSQEFENILLQGRKRILDLVKGGNPFLIQSNIFTLIHQIKQLSNFSSLKDQSPKSELLLEHLESIVASGKKAIIFSQYDKQGIQKIERLLKQNSIRYVLYQAGMPIKELENSAAMFRKDSQISVMLTGLTSANLKVRIPEAPYIIHFDQWWNPIVQWHFDDKTFNSDDASKPHELVNILNYYGNNSVEIKIRETLLKKGLMTKNLIEFLSNEAIYSLITNEDWLDILEIEHTRSINNELPDLDNISKKIISTPRGEIHQNIKLLFTKLGYKNLILKPDLMNDTATIYGSVNKNLQEIKIAIYCTPATLTEHDTILKFTSEAVKMNNRIFVFCSDEISNHLNKLHDEKVTYIGQRMLANYFSLFKII